MLVIVTNIGKTKSTIRPAPQTKGWATRRTGVRRPALLPAGQHNRPCTEISMPNCSVVSLSGMSGANRCLRQPTGSRSLSFRTPQARRPAGDGDAARRSANRRSSPIANGSDRTTGLVGDGFGPSSMKTPSRSARESSSDPRSWWRAVSTSLMTELWPCGEESSPRLNVVWLIHGPGLVPSAHRARLLRCARGRGHIRSNHRRPRQRETVTVLLDVHQRL